jgi:hypothetical protein
VKSALMLIGIFVGIILLCVGFSAGLQLLRLTQQETVVDTIVKSERVTSGDSSKYLIYGKNEVYENTDMFVIGKTNSSDFYRDIQPGKTYRLKVAGRRVSLFSWYRNIIAFEEVKEE